MLKFPRSLKVQYHGTDVGRLSMTPDNSRCVFEYDRRWLAARNGGNMNYRSVVDSW